MINFAAQYMPWIWVGVTVVCIVVESLTLALTTVWFACGAFVMVFLSLTGIPLPVQLLLFALVSLALLIFTRPLVMRRLRVKKTAMNSDRLIGRHALVTQRITPLQKGVIKVNGLEWSAKCADEADVEVGTEVAVLAIEGVTAVVKPHSIPPKTEKTEQ